MNKRHNEKLYILNYETHLGAEGFIVVEVSLLEVAVLPRSDLTPALDPDAARSTNQIALHVAVRSVRGAEVIPRLTDLSTFVWKICFMQIEFRMQTPLLGLHQKLACTILCSSGVADPGFSRFSVSTLKVKMQAYYSGRFFSRKLHEISKNWKERAVYPQSAPYDPPMLCLYLESWEAHEKILRSHLVFDKT